MWRSRRCLLIEEVSMVSPSLYNMLLFRSFHGRACTHSLKESEYDKLKGAFGGMPIVIHLGDFLQKKPIGGPSLIEDIQALEEMKNHKGEELQLAPEAQMAMKLFCNTPLCFELRISNRFRTHLSISFLKIALP